MTYASCTLPSSGGTYRENFILGSRAPYTAEPTVDHSVEPNLLLLPRTQEKDSTAIIQREVFL